jgi:hypothetical protein
MLWRLASRERQPAERHRDGAGTFAEGSSITVTAAPTGSHSFANWTQNVGRQHVGELYVHHAQRQYHADGSLQVRFRLRRGGLLPCI